VKASFPLLYVLCMRGRTIVQLSVSFSNDTVSWIMLPLQFQLACFKIRVLGVVEERRECSIWEFWCETCRQSCGACCEANYS
jgi:hypothetical protein